MKIDTTPRCWTALIQVTTAGGFSSPPKVSAGGFFFGGASEGMDQKARRAGGAGGFVVMRPVGSERWLDRQTSRDRPAFQLRSAATGSNIAMRIANRRPTRQ